MVGSCKVTDTSSPRSSHNVLHGPKSEPNTPRTSEVAARACIAHDVRAPCDRSRSLVTGDHRIRQGRGAAHTPGHLQQCRESPWQRAGPPRGTSLAEETNFWKWPAARRCPLGLGRNSERRQMATCRPRRNGAAQGVAVTCSKNKRRAVNEVAAAGGVEKSDAASSVESLGISPRGLVRS